MLQFLHIITGKCRDYIHKELKKLSRQMYAIEALLKEGNAGRGREDEVVAEDLLPPLPLMTLQQFLQCENQLKVDIYMRKQFVSIFILLYLLNVAFNACTVC